MNAEAILTKIQEDARDAAAKLTSDAEARTAEIGKASREKIETMRRTMLEQAEKDGEEQRKLIARMASLDDRKRFLAKKRALIDETFALAAKKLAETSAADRRAFFLQRVVACAAGGERVIVGAENADWFDDAFIGDCSAALSAQGKRALTLANERRNGCAGVILASEGMEISCTLNAMLDDARAELEQQVATTLFDAD